MKKLLSLLVSLFLLCSSALAEIDLSVLTFDELAALRDQCQLEMMSRDQWQEVTVPQGLYEVGVHIPAGDWTIRCADTGRDNYLLMECLIRWGEGRPGDRYFWDYGKKKGEVEIYNPNNTDYSDQVQEFTITLEVGDFIYIDPEYNRAVFTPYSGVPSFNFK